MVAVEPRPGASGQPAPDRPTQPTAPPISSEADLLAWLAQPIPREAAASTSSGSAAGRGEGTASAPAATPALAELHDRVRDGEPGRATYAQPVDNRPPAVGPNGGLLQPGGYPGNAPTLPGTFDAAVAAHQQREQLASVHLPEGTLSYRDPGHPDLSREVRINDVSRLITNLQRLQKVDLRGLPSGYIEEVNRQWIYMNAINRTVLPQLLGMDKPYAQLTGLEQQMVREVGDIIVASYDPRSPTLLSGKRVAGELPVVGRKIAHENLTEAIESIFPQIRNLDLYRTHSFSSLARMQSEPQRIITYLMENYRHIIEHPQYIRRDSHGEYRLVGEHASPILPDINNIDDVADFLEFYRRTEVSGQGQKQLLTLLKEVGNPKRITEHPIVAMREAAWGKGTPHPLVESRWLAAMFATNQQLTDSNPLKGGRQRLDQLMGLHGVERQIANAHMAERFTFLTFKAHANPRQDAVALLLPEQFCTPQIMTLFLGEPPAFPNLTVIPLDGSVDVRSIYASFYQRAQQEYQSQFAGVGATGDPYATPDLQTGKQVYGRAMSTAASEAPTIPDGLEAVRVDSLSRLLEKDRLSFSDRAEVRGILDSVQTSPVALARRMLDLAVQHYRAEALMVDPRPEVEAQRGKKIAEAQALLEQAERRLHATEELLAQAGKSNTEDMGATRPADRAQTQPAGVPVPESIVDTTAPQPQEQPLSAEAQQAQARHLARLRGSVLWTDAFLASEGTDQLNMKAVKRVILDGLPPHLQHLPEYFHAMLEWEIVQAQMKKAK